MSSLERVFTRKEDQCAFIYAVAGYLGHLNEYASKKRGGPLIEYNVGGVAAIIEPLKKLGNEHAAKRMHYTDTNIDELVELLTRAWYIREDGTRQGSRPRSQRDYYNSELDPNGSLGIALAQFLATLEPLVDRTTAMMFNTSAGLLRRYGGFARSGSEHEAHFDDETGDEFYSLLRFFRSLYKMKTLEHKANLARAQELRHKGNEVFKMGRFGFAIELYTEALLLDPTNYILYSNRAAAYTYLNSTDNAITDLKQAIGIKNDFETAYARLGFSYLSRGNALESVKAYIKAIELAESNGSLAQYIQKLVESLSYAEQRALSQGSTREELSRLSSGIVSIRNKYYVAPRAPTPSGQRTQATQAGAANATPGVTTQAFTFPAPGNGDGLNQFQVFTDATQGGSDVMRQALNFIGNAISPAQTVQQAQGQQQGAGAQNNAQPPQPTDGQPQVFTSHFTVNVDDPNAPDVIRQTIGNMTAGLNQNPLGYIIQSAMNQTGRAQQPTQDQTQAQQQQAQQPQQPQSQSQTQQQPPSQTQQQNSGSSSGTDNTTPSVDDLMDLDVADPETSVPEPHVPPQATQGAQSTPNTSNTNNNNQQQPNRTTNAQSLQDIFLNALPSAMRNTVGPIIMQSLNNALNGGTHGQGATFTTVNLDSNGQPSTQTTSSNTGASSSTASPANGNASSSNTGSRAGSSSTEPNGADLQDLDLD